MFLYFYQVCLVILVLQGAGSPFLLVLLGYLMSREGKRIDALKQEMGEAEKERTDSKGASGAVLKQLPKLKPLNCPHCGAGVLLRENDTFCPNCRQPGELPPDYADAVSLKAQVRALLKRALRHWRAARVITYPLMSTLFFVLIFAEPFVFFPAVIIGSNVYPKAPVAKFFDLLNAKVSMIILVPSFLGFIVWMVVFILLTGVSRELRAKLPAAPRLPREARGSETANCQACGGGIQYDAGDFACICDYCHVENFRAQFVQSARAQGQKHKAKTQSILFGAMEILEDFIGTLFVVLLIMYGGAALTMLFYALKHWLND